MGGLVHGAGTGCGVGAKWVGNIVQGKGLAPLPAGVNLGVAWFVAVNADIIVTRLSQDYMYRMAVGTGIAVYCSVRVAGRLYDNGKQR